MPSDMFKCGTVLIDRGNEDLRCAGNGALVVPADDTWYMVNEHESVAFVNSAGKFICDGSILLISCGR